jgi:hypothetical protein
MTLASVLTLILAAQPASNPQAVADVAAGKCKTAQASWWGFDAQESTAALQAAIDSGAQRVVVDKMPGPWIVNRIRLRDNLELVFQPGVEVLAKRGAFHGTGDSLFSAAGKKNIKLVGPGATLRMWRTDYDGPEYKHAEWRHVLCFHACEGITVSGLTLAESGGDGIYLGAGSGGAPCKDVVIRDVVCDRNYRQGISVISAENLLIERCVLKDTAGTAPEAGIDFEPNLANECLVNCVMRDCVIENNHGLALHVYARAFDASTRPMSIRIENCVTRGTNARSASIITSCGPKGSVGGTIELLNCRFEDTGTAGMVIGSKSPRGPKLRLERCTFVEHAEQSRLASPIALETRSDDLDALGGIELTDVTIRDRLGRAPMKYNNAAGVPVVNVTGTLVVEHPDRRTVYQLDAATLDKLIPLDKALRVRPWPLAGTRWASPSTEWSGGKLPSHRQRNQALYLLSARQGDKVEFGLAAHVVGRKSGKPVTIELESPDGKPALRAALDLATESQFSFTAGQTGVYRLMCDAGNHAVRLTSSSHLAVMAGPRGPIHFIATTGDLYFLVPAGVKQFAARVWGEGDLERVSAAVWNPAGKRVWHEENVSSSQSFQMERPAADRDEIWRISLARPTKGVLEDHYVELRGVPPVLGFSPQGLLHPAGK